MSCGFSAAEDDSQMTLSKVLDQFNIVCYTTQEEWEVGNTICLGKKKKALDFLICWSVFTTVEENKKEENQTNASGSMIICSSITAWFELKTLSRRSYLTLLCNSVLSTSNLYIIIFNEILLVGFWSVHTMQKGNTGVKV